MHPGKKVTISTNDHIIVEADRRSGMISATFLLRRSLQLTLPEFRDYWMNVHAAIAKTIPGLKHYQICPVVDAVYMSQGGWGDPRWDGVEQLLFDDYDSARAAIQSAEFTDSFFPDFDRFSETREHFFSDVAMMAWPGRTRGTGQARSDGEARTRLARLKSAARRGYRIAARAKMRLPDVC